ncbi:MAG: hypothetical protein HKN43_10445 [Rhodothermales bacterium]|nr:hypothetical protein [Rhodothermales bacterium]
MKKTIRNAHFHDGRQSLLARDAAVKPAGCNWKISWIAVPILTFCMCGSAVADRFMVETTEGPGFATPDEAAMVLEAGILPLFAALSELESQKKIVAGGLPVGSRTFNLIVEAESHDEVDRMLRDLPGWGVFSWRITPLQSIQGRATMEQEILASLKSAN